MISGQERWDGLRDSFSRWIEQDQKLSRVNCETSDEGEPQAVGRPGYRELVADPVHRILVDLRTPHLCAVGVCVEFAQGCTYRLVFPIGLYSRSYDFRMHIHTQGWEHMP